MLQLVRAGFVAGLWKAYAKGWGVQTSMKSDEDVNRFKVCPWLHPCVVWVLYGDWMKRMNKIII